MSLLVVENLYTKFMNNNAISVSQKRNFELNELLNNSKNKSIFVGAITILLFIILMIFGVIPSIRAVLAQNTENEVIKEVTKDVNDKINLINQLVSEREEKADVIEEFDNTFTIGYAQQEMIEHVYDIANNTVEIDSLSFPENYPITKSPYSSFLNVIEVKVNLRAVGSRRALIQFFDNLERSKQIYNIENVNFSLQPQAVIEEQGFDRAYVMTITFNYYFWSQNVTTK